MASDERGFSRVMQSIGPILTSDTIAKFDRVGAVVTKRARFRPSPKRRPRLSSVKPIRTMPQRPS
jgi:hypothetical protein